MLLTIQLVRNCHRTLALVHDTTIVTLSPTAPRHHDHAIPENQTKSSERKEDRDAIPIVDTDTLAMTVIELFGDARVAAKLKKALYPQELVDKLDQLTKRVSALTENLRERDERIKQLEKKVETLEFDSDKVEQYSRRSNLRFSGIPEADNDVEDTTEKILQIINDDMEVPVSSDQVERSHRLGPKVDKNGKARQRNIIIRFNRESGIQGKVQPENQKQRWTQEGLRK